MTDLSQGLYTLLTGCETLIRSNYAAIKSTVDTETAGESVSLPALQTNGENVYIGDDRVPPQAQCWVRIAGSLSSESVTLSRQSRTQFSLTITTGIRHNSVATSDPSLKPGPAGWRTASLFSRAVAHTLIKHIPSSVAGAYNVDLLTSSQSSNEADEYEYSTDFIVFMITHHAFNS